MNNATGFRVGFMSHCMPADKGVKNGMERYEWALAECGRLGAKAISFMPFYVPEGAGKDTLKEMAAMAKEKDVKIITGCRGMWGLKGAPALSDQPGGQIKDPAEAIKAIEESIERAKIFDCEFLTGAYNGALCVRASRWSDDFTMEDHRKAIVGNLKELSKILDGTGITFALENHIDFSGKEIASFIEDVAEDNIRVQYDFGNAACIHLDPMNDVEYLAPYAVTAHFKDFKVRDNLHWLDGYPAMPQLSSGCYLGEGMVDFDVILQALIDKAPHPQGMVLLAEPAFRDPDEEEAKDLDAYSQKICRQYVTKMLEIVQKY